MTHYYIEVVLPLPLDTTFTYRVSEKEFAFIQPGIRVAVPFGKTKIYTGVCLHKHHQPPVLYEAKDIHLILDEHPVVLEKQIQHWEWISKYYLCSLGEVFKAALPNTFFLESETLLEWNTSSNDYVSEQLSDQEYLIFEALQYQNLLSMEQATKILGIKKVWNVIHPMLQKGWIKTKESMVEKYVPKTQKFVRIAKNLESPEKLNEVLQDLGKSHPKRHQLMMHLFQMQATLKKPIKEKELLDKAQVSSGVLKAMIQNQWLENYYLTQDRLDWSEEEMSGWNLTEVQQKIVQEIEASFLQKDITLLHAVTSSGKTEIYTELIQKQINQGKQVLYLVPEIALTTQLVIRLQKHFGNTMLVYHSKFSNQERTEVWNKLLYQPNDYSLVLGARSALFLPLTNLGFIVVDEEHEANFKQTDPAPRYHARDAALVLAKQHQAKVLLGTATPSLESFYHALKGKYGLVTNKVRFGNYPMPEISLVSMKEAMRKKQMHGHFTKDMLQGISEALTAGKQVMIFQNRRGFAPVMECETCGHIPNCIHCDVSLTYHQIKQQLRCHYCGYAIPKPQHCHACHSNQLSTKGFGTEQIELELLQLFPKARVIRMDQDTTRGKYQFEKIIEQFQQQEADILVGTQMIAKGLNFSNVGLVGVLHADQLLFQPDFRSIERAFQLLTQVSGRTGRGEERGKVIIQTYQPEYAVLQMVQNFDYEGFYANQIAERKQFLYPPFTRIIKIQLKGKNFENLTNGSQWFANSLRNVLAVTVLGPEEPLIAKIKNEYIRVILIKIPRNSSVDYTKKSIQKIKKSFESIGNFKNIKLQLNVDAY